jgi:hypothetical protein
MSTERSLVVLVCAKHGTITTPIPNTYSEIDPCVKRHRAAGCTSRLALKEPDHA